MPKSAYLRSKIIKHVTGDTAYTMPTTLYLALFSSDPTINNTGTEISGGTPAYARKPITFGAESNGEKSNSSSISIDPPTTTVTHWGVFDAVSGGNLLYFDSFEVPISATTGTPIPIAAGDLILREL